MVVVKVTDADGVDRPVQVAEALREDRSVRDSGAAVDEEDPRRFGPLDEAAVAVFGVEELERQHGGSQRLHGT